MLLITGPIWTLWILISIVLGVNLYFYCQKMNYVKGFIFFIANFII